MDQDLNNRWYNYNDAKIYGTVKDVWQASWWLQKRWQDLPHKDLQFLRFEETLLRFASLPDGITRAEKELYFPLFIFLKAQREGLHLSEKQIQEAINSVPNYYRDFLNKQIRLLQHWAHFVEAKKEFSQLIGMSITPLPWEPQQLEFIPPDKPSLLIYPTFAYFCHTLYQEPGLKAACDPNHAIYILELHPQKQLERQATSNKEIVLTDDLPQILKMSLEYSFDDLYQLGKSILFEKEQKRLGINHIAALTHKKRINDWHDIDKSGKPVPIKNDLFKQHLEHLSTERKVRESNSKKPKAAHVVPQLVEPGHAPTTLLKQIIFHHHHLDPILISSELLLQRPQEYPYPTHISTSSLERAPQLLNELKQNSIPHYILNQGLSFEETAKEVIRILSAETIDVVIFHGPDVINEMAAQLTDAPLRVLFDHGTPPRYSGFDLILLSTQEAEGIYKDLLDHLGSSSVVLPFAHDVRKEWPTLPPSKHSLGLPEGFLMTTISNHLDDRLGSEMRRAIISILKVNPKAYYVPIGSANRSILMEDFAAQGVDDRVIFLGHKNNPSHWARCMQLYLNEFPFGSGLGILEAMAAGLPVVTMYNEDGPPQARYGGSYFGIEYAISNRDINEYVSLATQLIQDPMKYQKWSEHALQRYNERIGIEAYMQTFENTILTYMKSRS